MPERGVEAQDSELVLENGTVSAEGWEALGIQAGAYTASKLCDGTRSFNAPQTSLTNGTVTLSGTIDANGDLADTAVWTKPGGSPVTYALDGARDLGSAQDKDAMPPRKEASKPR